MKHTEERNIKKSVLLTLIFIIVVEVMFVVAGIPAWTLALTKIDMAVDLGSPVYEYSGHGQQPGKGEIKKNDIRLPSIGSRYGTMICERVDLKAPLYFGDTYDILSEGAGQYAASGLPGEGRSILVGAHDMGYFAPLESIEKGDMIDLNTSYGEFEYRVTGMEIKDTSYYGLDEFDSVNEELVLYTCFPFGSFAEDSVYRYFVTAEKISGPVLVEK